MKIYRDPRQLTSLRKPLFLTIGTFDGVHLGHLKVLESLKKAAQKNRGISCVLTFKSHPQETLHPEKRPKLLTPTLHKLVLLDRVGIDACFLLDFTKVFAGQTPESFVKNFLVKKLKVKEVHLGYKSHFGAHRTGNTQRMAQLASEYGFKFKEAKPYQEKGIPLSSTLIRHLIHEGDLKRTSHFLGRPFSLLGTTVHGIGLGKKLGFPTANLDIRSELVPPPGVYAVQVNILKMKDWIVRHGDVLDSKPEVEGLRGVMNLGFRPTIEPHSHKLIPEVHLLDFHKSIYGRVLEVVFHKRLRSEKKFASIPILQRQIARDLETAKKILRVSS